MRKKPFLIVLLSLVLGLTALPARALPLVQTAVPAVSVRSEQMSEDVLIAVPDRLAPANLPVLPETGADPDTPALLRNRGPLVFPTDSAAPSDLPASYLVATTPIRDQGANDLCWAFSTYGVMESWLLNHGHGSYDLSEMHMAYATSNHSSNPYGFYRAPADGGNRVVATSYLMRGTHKDAEGYDLCIGGAVLENEDPYSVDRLPDRPLADTFYYKEKVLMPENALFLCGLKNEGQGMTTEDVKQAILQYGAVGAAMTWDKSVANGTTGNGSTDHYNAATAAYYLNTTGVGTSYYMNHMVTIVGWDDAFPRESFNENCRPSSNGAWRIRNSWGTDWGDGGFAWISYEDADFPSEIWAITGITGYDSATMRTHEYDYAIDTYGYWAPFETNLFLRYFEVTEAEDLTSVRVFLPAAYSYVEVDVIPDFMNTDMSTYTFRTLTGLSARYPGWYTINLPYPQPLTPLEGGTRYFAVVIRSSNPLAYDLSCRDNSMFCMDGYNNWYYTTDPNYPSEGWCIKAVCKTDPPKVTGWIFNDGDWYYFDDDGVMQTGWNTIGGKMYYFDGSGAMQTGWKKIDGLWYYFDENGAMQTGWLKTGGKWYFLDSSGAMQTGWLKTGGRWYYLDGDGVMITGWLEDGGKRYYFGGSGAMVTGWQKDGSSWYYLGGSGAMVTGWKTIDGKMYFFNADGVMQTGWKQENGKWYYLAASGQMATGWKAIGGKTYFFRDTGAMLTGWYQEGGKWYYLNASGQMVTGWAAVDGKTYYFKNTGAMAANEWCKGYWLNANGTWTYPHTGAWQKDSGGWRFVDTSGWFAKNTTVTIDGISYSFDAAGYWIE